MVAGGDQYKPAPTQTFRRFVSSHFPAGVFMLPVATFAVCKRGRFPYLSPVLHSNPLSKRQLRLLARSYIEIQTYSGNGIDLAI